jgi:hypothetical protein
MKAWVPKSGYKDIMHIRHPYFIVDARIGVHVCRVSTFTELDWLELERCPSARPRSEAFSRVHEICGPACGHHMPFRLMMVTSFVAIPVSPSTRGIPI